MLDIVGKHWKEVATNGLFVAFVFVLSLLGMGLVSAIHSSLGLLAILGWFLNFLMPIYWFALLVYVTLFMALVCIKFQERLGTVAQVR